MKNNNSRVLPRRAAAQPLGELLEQVNATLTAAAEGEQADPVQGNSDVLVSQWEKQFAGEDVSPLTIGIRLRRVAMLIDEMAAQASEAEGLKLNEMLLLMALRRVGPPHALRPTDILKMHSVTSGTVTYRIDQLTKQELAVRVDDPSDRRGFLIELTPRGLKIVDAVLHHMLETFRKELDPIMKIPGAFAVLEDSLRLFERCISRR
jgi:DNA-binding MarR family transcriptional regulator